ncbi:hypothetical protein [Stenotrophomonas sp. NPDC078853]|uniref:hypothetical protein n=1 Tax=Stenotrophomonas sp. NPDC078853 TaxID=3364534 RepID=UPI00384DAC11
MKIPSSIPFRSCFPAAGGSRTDRPSVKGRCGRFAHRLLACAGLRERSSPIPASTALVAQLRNVLDHTDEARKREVRPSSVAEKACTRLRGRLVGDETCACTYADLAKDLNRLENAYARQELELRQSWRNSWLSGTETYGDHLGNPVDHRSEAAATVMRAIILARSEVHNLRRMTPYIS